MPIQPEYLHLAYTGPFPTLLYGRASRDPKKRGRSVASQIKVLREMCDRHGWPVVGVFDKDINRSASRHRTRERDDFEALIDAIESGKARIVAAFEASRYYRDIEIYIRIRNACARNGVLFCYNGAIYDLSKREDRRATAQDALQAEDEAEGIQVRNMRTHNELAATGAPVGRCPEGYLRRYDPETGELIDQIEHPQRGKNVREIFRRYDAGEGMLDIVRDFEKRGLVNQHGKPYGLYHVTHILQNRTYTGRRIRHGQDVGKGQWPALVDEPTFNRVQKRRLSRDKRKNRDTSAKYLATMIAECGKCHAANGPEAEPEVLHSLLNRGLMSYLCRACFGVTMEMRKFDAYVETGLLRWLASPAAAAAFRSGTEAEERTASARRLRDVLQQQLVEAREAVATVGPDGRPLLSVLALADLESRLIPQIERAQRDSEEAGVPPLLRGLVGADDVDERWEQMSIGQRRDVLRAVVNVRLNPARSRGVRAIEPGRIEMIYVGQPGFRG
ncbi:recombinase family protein [Streptomyces sp. NPDC012950]|uniref:recombinase family protein n=1 Tax=Streptomyces sp. NPDC012950 TaxID=3364858 RepID=UPI00367A02D2